MSFEQKRRHPRQTRRIQVRYTVEGESRIRRGFTKNISLSGALVTGHDLPGRGSLLRMELVGKNLERVVYARVVHAHRVPPEMRRFAESGMGIRFLRQEELIGPFLAEGGAAAAVGEPDRRASAGTLGSGPWPISGGPAAQRMQGAEADGQPDDEPEGVALEPPPLETPAPPAASSPRKPRRQAPTVDAEQSFELRYETPADFLAAYRRDLVNGGLFVATTTPAALYDTVTIKLHLPPPVRQVFRFESRVVQVVEARQAGGGGGGVGLEVLDTDRVLTDLRPVVDLLK